MQLNKTERLLLFFVVFLNLIPSNNAQALRRSDTNSKANINWSHIYFEAFKQLNESFINKSLRDLDNRFPKIMIADDKLEINYSPTTYDKDNKNNATKVKQNLSSPRESIKSKNNSDNIVDENQDILELPKDNNFYNQSEIEIRSDSQSEIGNILYANGNVLVIYKDNFFNADKIVYDKEKRIINAKGNIVFVLKNDIFQADVINYDFINETGSLQKVKGLINTDNEIINLDFLKTDSLPEEILNKLDRKKILYTPSKIRNWVFTTDELVIIKNKWFAKEANFTNDLFESKHINFKIKALKIVVEENLIRLKSGLSYLVLEDKFSLPFWLSEQKISTKEESDLNLEESINRWGIGYDRLDRDGYFINRKSDKINLFGDYQLQLKTIFLAQRLMQGYSKSFVQKGYSITSDKITTNTSFKDYFGFESNINGQIGGWNHRIEKKLNTLDFENLPQALRVKVEFSKKIDFLEDQWNNKFYWVYRDRVWNGSQGESEIYEGYGWKLEKNKSWNVKQITKNSYLGFGFGRFTAEELNSKNLSTSYKGSIFYKLGQKFPIHIDESSSKFIDQSYLYLPEPIKKGIYLDTEISALSNFYRNGIHQEYVRFGAGPEFVMGDFKKSAFDYTRLRLFPFYKITSGKSVFKFDQISDKFALDINLDQHLIGPILVKTYGRLNLNNSSKDYGKFTESKVSLNWKRRSYEFGIFYQPNQKSGGIQFSLFGFK